MGRSHCEEIGAYLLKSDMNWIFLSAIFLAGTASIAAESLHLLFAQGSDEALLAFVQQDPARVERKDDMQCTALHYAARYARLKTAKWLIEHKADVNTVAYNKFTPMHVVTDGAVARILIEAGADLKARDAWNKTPLQNAARMRLMNVCEAILSSGFPIDLCSALHLRKRDLAKKMIKDDPAIAKHVGADQDPSPLGVAAAQGDKEMVEFLLEAGAPVNAIQPDFETGPITALCHAVWSGHHEIVGILCKAGADCNVAGGRLYSTLLSYALHRSDKKMVDLLIHYGAKPSDRS